MANTLKYISSTNSATYNGSQWNTVPTIQHPRQTSLGPNWLVGYSIDPATGKRVASGATGTPHRLAYQFGNDHNTPRGSFDFSWNIMEKSGSNGDRLIAWTMTDHGYYDTARLLYNSGSVGACSGKWGSATYFNCAKNYCCNQVKYHIGYVTPDDGNQVHWLFTDNNVHDAFQGYPMMATGGSNQPADTDVLRKWKMMRYEAYMALNAGDKIIFRLLFDTIDSTKNWGWGLGNQFVNMNVMDMSKGTTIRTEIWANMTLAGNALSGQATTSRGYDYSNSLARIYGPSNAMAGLGVLKDAGLSATLGYDVFSVTVT